MPDIGDYGDRLSSQAKIIHCAEPKSLQNLITKIPCHDTDNSP